MRATVKQILQPRLSRNSDVYFQRIKLTLQDGSFAMTDLVSSFRNFKNWEPVIEAGVGTVIDNVGLKEPGKVDADSQVVIVKEPLIPSQRKFEGMEQNGVRRFKVKSKTMPGYRIVALFPSGAMECDCPGFLYRNKCEHVESVKTYV